MKAVVAMLKHETNTFSPVRTPLARFGANGPLRGEAARLAMQGTRTAMGAYLDLCLAHGIETVTPLAADARPSGPAPAEVYEALCQPILEAVAQGCDLVMLDLHGAMVAEGVDDGEGELLRRLRALQPGLPIAVALDMHANLSEAMVEHCTVLAGYRTYPHLDHYETGERAARTLLRALAGQCAPRMGYVRLPSLAHTLRMGTADEPFRTLLAQAMAIAQRPGILDAVVFGGFALADVPHPNPSLLLVSDAMRIEAADEQACLADWAVRAWSLRDHWVYRSESLQASLQRAASSRQGPVLLIDHADNCASGGTQDTMHLLRAALAHGLTDILLFAVCDPEAVSLLCEAGQGSERTLAVGGKMDMPALGLRGEPLVLTGTVRRVGDGQFVLSGPMQTGARVSMGRTVVFETAAATLVICERHHEPWDLAALQVLGLDPTRFRYVMLKSRMAYRAAFLPIARAVVECDACGVTSSDYGQFPYRRLARPVHPLDSDCPLNLR
ncbi:M81 family metallopeptidase [Orrella sp. JC864]|uniref:M81 family metallopeptidase n=1 Tax=Orrella sp. JC864 TaxID=3120298 RepID=UPI003008AB49